MKSISLLLENGNFAVLDQKYMEDFFQKELPKYFPDFKKLVSLKIKDNSSAEFKKAIEYSLIYKKNNGQVSPIIIRGNIPSLDTTYEAEIANDILQALSKKGFSEGKFQTNKPLDYYPELRILLYQDFPGETLTDFITNKKNDIEMIVAKSAEWLLKFHQLKLKIGKVKTFEREAQEAEWFQMNYHLLNNGLASSCESIMAKILKLKKSFANVVEKEAVTIHGDYHPDNILIDGDKIGVIDFGGAWQFDPLSDIGKFLVQLEICFIDNIITDKNLLQKLQDVFIKKYFQSNMIDETYNKIILYETWWVMQILSYRLASKIKPETIEKTFALARRLDAQT